MAPCSPSQNLDGSYHSCDDRYFTGICRRTIQNCSRSAVYALCLRYADRRQLHQRPLRLPERIGVIVILSCISGLGLLYTSWGELPHGGWELIVLGVFCVIFAFLYTTVLSYQGWGDLLVLIFFGFVPVGGTYYVQAYTFTPNVIIASLISGLVIDTLLVVNNYRDRDQDALSGKRTLIVRFGEPFGRYLYLWLGIIATLLSFWFAQGWNYAGIFMPFTYLYFHVTTWKRMVKIRSGKKLNSILGETSRNMLFMGILLSVIIAITNR